MAEKTSSKKDKELKKEGNILDKIEELENIMKDCSTKKMN